MSDPKIEQLRAALATTDARRMMARDELAAVKHLCEQQQVQIEQLHVLAIDLYECADEENIEQERGSFLRRAPWLKGDGGNDADVEEREKGESHG